MSLSRRAALLSGLVLPGLGQLLLGQRKKGVLLMIVVVALVIFLAVRIFLVVYHGLVPSGDLTQMSLAPEAIKAIHHQAYAENWWLLAMIIALWLASIADAVIKGREMDRKGPLPGK